MVTGNLFYHGVHLKKFPPPPRRESVHNRLERRPASERSRVRRALHSIYIYERASERESRAQGGERANGERRSGEALHLPSPTLSPHTRELRRAPAMRAPSHARARSSSPLTLRYSGRTTYYGC
ncbi:hypothetical protein HPB50_002774 [Hyalomma asiaticum]|uniref:Uncharacterized protein n=1 Tax=Hyalomma asiaticum TaxID=266040 RepID=A0ACB7S3S0_HYAAI|nr:hypothetical protein HPB50_002774 [Hyalomma asiaticum]